MATVNLKKYIGTWESIKPKNSRKNRACADKIIITGIDKNKVAFSRLSCSPKKETTGRLFIQNQLPFIHKLILTPFFEKTNYYEIRERMKYLFFIVITIS